MEETKALGRVLVVGGCGFFGYHLVQTLLNEPDCGPVFALSRSPTVNLQDKVTYLAGDISDEIAMQNLIHEIQPHVIFHTASPLSKDGTIKRREFVKTNVTGTKNLLDVAASTTSVQAFVYTSSVGVYAGSEHIDLDESQPVWDDGSGGTPYDLSKSAAEKLVLTADCDELFTVVLRPCLIYGERDNSMVPGLIGAPTNVQLGNNTNLIDSVSVENAATVHILAAKALLDSSRAKGKVHGEAFNITDENPIPFWNLSRLVWRAAGDVTPVEQVHVLPVWLALTMASVAEFFFFIFSFGQKKPETLNTLLVTYCVRSHTYNIDKLKQAFDYSPVPMLEAGIKRSVAWELERRQKGGGQPALGKATE